MKAITALLALGLLLTASALLTACERDRTSQAAASPAAAEETGGWRALTDLAQGRFGIVLGSTLDPYLQQTYPRATIVRFQNAADMILALKSDHIDAAFMDTLKASVPLRTNPELAVLEQGFYSSPLGIGFRKDDDLRQRFDRFLDEIRRDGTLDAMHRRWIDDPEHAVMPELPVIEPRETRALGVVAAGDLPYAARRDGQYVGLDIELVKRFAAREGIALRIEGMEFGALIPALISGKLDLIAYGIYITDERRKSIDFSAPYLEATTAALVRRDRLAAPEPPPSPASGGWRTLDDLARGRIGVFTGTATDLYASRVYPEADIVRFNSQADFVLALQTGKVDTALTDRVGGRAIVHENPELAILDDDFYDTDIAAAFRKEDRALRQRFDRFLEAARADGTLAAIEQRWMEEDPGQAVMPPIPIPETGEPLRVGTSLLVGLPFVAFDGSQYIGFDMELMRHFAAREGFALEIVPLEFDSLIAALGAGKIDMIASSLSVTEERRARVDFSTPYSREQSAALVQRENLAASARAASAAPSGLLHSLKDLAQGRIAIFVGTVHDAFLARHYPEARIIRLNGTADLVLSIKTGKADAALLEKATAQLILKTNPDLAILDENILDLPLGVGFRPDRGDLRERFNRFLARIRADGVHDDMYRRWFIADAETAAMPRFEPVQDGERVRVGISVEDLPYVGFASGEYVGFDIELIRRFADAERLALELVPLEFDALFNALASGKVDFVTDGIAITEERSRVVAFSDPYLDLHTVALARRDRVAGAAPLEQTAPTAPSGPADASLLAELRRSLESNFILEQRWKLIVNGIWVTIEISVLSTLFGTLLGGLVCYLRMSARTLPRLIGSGYIFLIRGLPVLLLLLLIFYVAFASINIDPVIVAVIAFGMNFAAYVSEMFRTGIESVDRGQTEAGIALGFTRVQTFLYIVLPQAVRRILPVYRGEFISLVKMTSIVGYIGVQDLTKAGDIIRSRTFEAFFPLMMVAAIYFFVIWVLGLALDHLDRRTDPQARLKRGKTA